MNSNNSPIQSLSGQVTHIVQGRPTFKFDVNWHDVPDEFIKQMTKPTMMSSADPAPQKLILMLESDFQEAVQQAAIAMIIEKESLCNSKADSSLLKS